MSEQSTLPVSGSSATSPHKTLADLPPPNPETVRQLLALLGSGRPASESTAERHRTA